MKAAFADQPDLRWTLQSEQLGTGHAVMQAMPSIPDDHQVLVLLGDVPLVRTRTLQRLVNDSGEGELALLTAVADDPSGYGRVIRDERGEVARIVEEKDATDDERRVNEVNTGVIAFGAAELRRCLASLDNDNSQGEYYLTDVIAMSAQRGIKVHGIVVDSATEVLGINDRAQLALAERTLQRQIAQDLMSRGVAFADPERVDVRGTLTAGRDVFIDVGAVFEGNVELGDNVTVGPYAVITDSKLGAGTVVHPHSVMNGIVAGPNCEIGPFARLTARRGPRVQGQGRQLRGDQEEHGRGREQDQSSELRRRRDDRPRRERRRRHDHVQLRRREQASHHDRRSRVRRLRRDARGASLARRRRDDRCRLDHHEGRAGKRAHARAVEASDGTGLATPEEEVPAIVTANRPIQRG